jgi:hypothetical protein
VPNGAGGRGIVDAVAQIIAREVVLYGDASAGHVAYTLRLNPSNVSGYAPSGLVAASGITGAVVTLDVATIPNGFSGTGDDVRAVLALARDKGPTLVARLDAAAGRIDAILAALDGAKLGNAVERLAPAAETVASGVQGASKDLHLVTSDMRDAARRMDALFARLDATLGRLDGIDEAAVREFLQVQGVRVNVLPDPAVAGLVKSLREKSPEKKPSKPSKSTTSSPGSREGTPAQP